jgi:hypothetical protein
MDTREDEPPIAADDASRGQGISQSAGSAMRSRSASSEEIRPPLPPRPGTISLLDENSNPLSPQTPRPSTRAGLQSQATTALSLKDISSQNNPEVSKETLFPGFPRNLLGKGLKAKASLSQLTSARGSETGDSASVRSYMPSAEGGEEESIFGDLMTEGANQEQSGKIETLGLPEFPEDDGKDDFVKEFEPVGELAEDGHNEGPLL